MLTPANRCLTGSTAFLDAKHAVIEEQLEKQPGEHLVLVQLWAGDHGQGEHSPELRRIGLQPCRH